MIHYKEGQRQVRISASQENQFLRAAGRTGKKKGGGRKAGGADGGWLRRADFGKRIF